MKKFLYSAAVVLAFGVADARAAHFQAGSVRVGPASEDVAASNDDAPAPKKDEKKVKPAGDEKGERRVEASKETPSARGVESDEKNSAAEKARASEKSQKPAPLSNATASTVTPPITNNPSATSDAPSKPGSDTNIPVGSPVKTASGAEGTSEANRTKPPATGSQTANTPDPSAVPATLPAAPATTSAASATAAVSLASVYRVGIGDVLDIRLLNNQDPRQSTLYPVIAGGVLDFPLLHDPLTVAGMTTDELAAQLIAEFRHRGIYDRPQVRVSVREYASHAVLVSGLVNDPGTKILRREAIPLYVVVAEAQPKPEAGRAVIVSHATGKSITVDLNDAAALNTLVQSGDVISLTLRPPEFFYVGGEIGSPGQKDFHAGMTLTQAVLASGGVTRLAGERIRVARQGADGRLVSTDYNLSEIEGGVVPDPTLQPGDRIEVSARRK
jgi:protein involved in polysaccharide export with SLBB domain